MKKEFKLLLPFYLEAFLGTLLYIAAPFMIVYFSSINLTSFQIGVLMAVMPLASLLFEIPTGAIADLYGRKFSVILGWVLEGILFIIVFFSTNYYFLLVMLALIGISNTFTTGSYDAWPVDLLKKRGMKNSILKFFSLKQSFTNFAFIFSGILGAFFVAKFGIAIIWPLSGMAFLISSFLLYFGEEEYEREKLHIKESFIKVVAQTKNSLAYSYKHNVLFYISIIVFISGIAFTFSSLISWTPLLKSFNFSDANFGYLWSASGAIGVIAPLIANKITKRNKEKRFLILAAVFSMAISLLVLFAGNLKLLVFLFFAGFFIFDFDAPIWRTYSHRFMPSKMRATIGSAYNMLASLAGIVAMPLAGLLIDRVGARETIFISGLLMLPVIFLYFKIKKNS